ncbi:hypothetical protein E0L35_21580 [Halomonas sp. ATBC28]|nr:hypothetical protein E0L35_21580 [Halomonas sp. ATBC28]
MDIEINGKVITRWIKRHLQQLGAEVNLEQLNSLVEDSSKLRIEDKHWARVNPKRVSSFAGSQTVRS